MNQVFTINPATEETLKRFDFQSESELERGVQGSFEAFEHWRKVDLKTRGECVRDLAESLKGARMTLAELISREMGKPITEALAEVDKCAASSLVLCEKFPEWRKIKERDAGGGYVVRYSPMGPLLGIMPWNFPLWQVVRFAVPALLGGNTILLKHAPNTWGSAEFIEELFRQAFPDSVYQNLRMDVGHVEKLIQDRRVRGVSLTGSRRAGSQVGRIAGEHIKKCVLELGGSDAYVLLDDADVERAAVVCAHSRMINAGQSCVAAKRFIVTKKNLKIFTEAMIAELKKFEPGDPLSPRTKLGPMARIDLREELAKQVRASVAKGATLALGGTLPEGKGYFYPASVLVGVTPGQAAFDEELFGPVAAIIEARDEEQAIELANRSHYGLGGALFSKDLERAMKLAESEFDSGMIAINDFVRSDAVAPFGGVKDSGLGRELGLEGAFEFMTIKSIFRKTDGR